MRKLAILLLAGAESWAHFPFVLPQAGGRSAEMVLSETLSVDPEVDVKMAARTQLKLRDANGEERPLELVLEGNTYRLATPGQGARVIYGQTDLGVMSNPRAPSPYWLVYHPKTILGPVSGSSDKFLLNLPVELVPEEQGGKVRLRLLARGRPLAGAEVTVIPPSLEQQKMKTDSEGWVGPFLQAGRYGAWARFWETAEGEREGKSYRQVRHYATLVFDLFPPVKTMAPMPEAAASFGAVVAGAHVYVYGGHIADTHQYSTEAVTGGFYRLNLGGGQWEKLPSGPALQGMNLAADEGGVYRVGGMAPRNPPGRKTDNHSVSSVARFVLDRGTWESLPDLPEPRSSHDVGLVGGKLFVVGGWNMRGSEPPLWSKKMFVLDFNTAGARWEELPQPFERRALIAAALDHRLFVLGGILASGAVSQDVDIYDVREGKWKKGPALPGGPMDSFAPAAAVYRGRLYVCLGDGRIYRLNEAEGRWEDVAQVSPRVAHRMVAIEEGLLVLGGARKGKNLNTVELVVLKP
ncbi:MAG: hypothetical protein NZV14_09310 [Bryobacteraceae bacterium]|nr:hypothetical protein [Bryobacteraceae bacterium]MDW8378349.1 hypothetical protein [Bryobacterales bacterium]